MQAILAAAAGAALGLVRARTCTAWALDPRSGGERAATACSDPRASGREPAKALDACPLRAHVLKARAPLRLDAADLEVGALGGATGERSRGSYLAVPLLARSGEVLGLLELVDASRGAFTAPDESLVVQLAQATAAAVESEQQRETSQRELDRLRQALAAAEVGTWSVDLKTGLDTRDGSLNEILGFAPVESTLPMGDFFACVHPDDQRRAQRAIERTLETREPYVIELRIVRPDGAIRWIRDKGQVLVGADGKAERVTGVACDITETRYLKERRDQFLVQLQTSLSASLVGTYIRDCRTGHVDADEGLVRLFDLAPGMTVSVDDYASRIHPDDRDAWIRMVNRCSQAGSACASEYRVVWPDGSVHWVLDKGELIFDAEGNHLYTAGACVEVTYRRQVEAEREELLQREREARRAAEEASRAKDEFLVTLSHELRTPLTAVLGWAQILRAGRLDVQRVQKGVEIIERNARAQAMLIEDLLDVSRIVTGKMRMAHELVPLAAVAEAAIETIRPGADTKRIGLRFEVDASAGGIMGDRDRLQQVVWNLLSNAVKFTPPGGDVAVRVAREGPHAEIVVSDTGRGIPAGFLPVAFDRFQQAESGLKRSHGGLGLGLAIARHIVELHGGTIEAESEGEGRGARFTVRLPACGPDLAPSPDAKASEEARAAAVGLLPLAGLTALVVEDEGDSRDLISLILEQNGVKVVTAASAKDARAALASTLPNVIVSDIGMPLEDGLTFVTGLRAQGPPLASIPAVALTAYTQTEERRRALAAGFQAHVAKPIDAARLVAVVQHLARAHAG
ncbi:two-component sensor histidine kinase [Minicystis rosea]|nr:two-component sensor histidine kinase [Minicystis rosea]